MTEQATALGRAAWPELRSTLGLVVLAIVFAIANPGYLSEGQRVGDPPGRSDPRRPHRRSDVRGRRRAGIDLSVASTMTLGAVVLGEFYVPGIGHLGRRAAPAAAPRWSA